MNWLREAISDSQTNKGSAKRVALIVAALSMGLGVVILAAAGFCGHDVALALTSLAVPLAGLGGHAYVAGKRVERSDSNQQKD